MPGLAQAQAAPDIASGPVVDSQATAKGAEIVVTGTSLRKVAPAGAEAITVTQQEVVSSSATSTQALLADIPQLNSFSTIPYAGQGGTQLTVNRTDLRNLPQGTGGGSPTLVLIDGHRFVGDGVNQTIPDVGVIPPGMIDHVEVVMDGGSSVYGADAIGGVINFVTKHDFDGLQVSAHHGFGDQYSTNSIDVLAGKKWDSGSVYVGYSYAENSNIANANRAYEHQFNFTSGVGLPTGLQCNPGNVQPLNPANFQPAGPNYAITGASPTTLAAGTQNLCDTSKYGDLFPREVRHSVMAGFHQDLSSSLELDVKGFYSHRSDTLNAGYLGYTVDINRASPLAPGYNPALFVPTSLYDYAQQVNGNFNSTAGHYVPTVTNLSTWGITPTLTWLMGHDWVMRAFYNTGSSRTTVGNPQVNAALLQSDVVAGTFNPHDPGAAANAGAIAGALNYDNYGVGVSSMQNAKVAFDGPVFRLPGGELRAAVGAEYLGESYHGVSNAFDTYQNVINTAVTPLSYYHRNEKSGFAELNIPVVGPDNQLSFINSFNISLAERYDRYSDFGGNWAPSLGASLKPVSWLNLRGKWNKAFQAPSPAQEAFTAAAATYYPSYFYGYDPLLINTTGNLGSLGSGGNPGASTSNGLINIAGTKPGLQPQRATTYDLGFDLSPPVLPGLTLHMTYFNITYKGEIGAPPTGSSPTYFSQFPNTYAMNPSYAQALAVMQGLGVSPASISNAFAQAGCTAASCNLYAIFGGLTQNLGGAKVSGLDFGFDYHAATGFGSVFGKMNGTYLLNYQTSPNEGQAFTANGAGNQNAGSNVPQVTFTATVGASVGKDFTGQMKWNHTGGFSLAAPAGLGQTAVGSFNTFDLYLQYDLEQGQLPPIIFSVGVTNLFDAAPPVYNIGGALGNGYAFGTLGRVVQIGANVKF